MVSCVVGGLRPQIVRALVSSETRKKTLYYLSKYPEGSYLEQIVKETGISHTNVLGAIFGGTKDYSKDLALSPLGLVDVIVVGRHRYYRLTPVGSKIIDEFQNPISGISGQGPSKPNRF